MGKFLLLILVFIVCGLQSTDAKVVYQPFLEVGWSIATPTAGGPFKTLLK